MRETVVAVRYAKAFIDVYKEGASLDSISGQLNEIAQVFTDNRQLRNVMLNPAISFDVKKNVLEDIITKSKVMNETADALRLVLKNGRIAIVKQVAEEFEKLAFAALGRVRVEVTSAIELSEEEKAALKEKLTASTGKEAVIDIKVDPSLIGGIVTRIGSSVADGSIKNQLRALQVGLN